MDTSAGAALATHDACGDRLFETQRTANRQHPLPHVDPFGVSESRHHQTVGHLLEAYHRHVGARVGAHHLGRHLGPVPHRHGHLGGALNHMAVGHHVARAVDHDSRAGSPPRHAWPVARIGVEEVLEDVRNIRPPGKGWTPLTFSIRDRGCSRFHVDADHARAQRLGGGGEGS